VSRLYGETAKALADSEIRQRFDEVGLEAVASRPEEFAKFVARDVAEMRELARKIALAKQQKSK
jgi:tripartite-type tricarboxylate transporter receptor subunit TctC